MKVDRSKTQGVTRRRALQKISVAAGGAALSIAAPSIVRGQQPQSLVVVSGGGSYEEAYRKAIVEPFQRETGIKVTYVSPAVDAKLKAQVDSGDVQWDFVELSQIAFRADAGKYLEEIDYSAFDKQTLDNLLPVAKQKYGVAVFMSSTVMAFSTAEYPANKPRPRGWADFWDVKKFPGARSLRAVVGGSSDPTTIEFALLAAGVPKDKLYPIDLDKAFASLDLIKPHISKFWTVGAEPSQMLTDRQIAMCSAWNGRMVELKAKGGPVDFQWDEAELTGIYGVIPKGTKNRAAAMKFAAYVSTAEAQARLNSLIFYGPTNRGALKLIKPDIAERLPTAAGTLEKQFFRDLTYWEAKTPSGKTNIEVLSDRWTKWVVS